jgi:hypothetical protein
MYVHMYDALAEIALPDYFLSVQLFVCLPAYLRVAHACDLWIDYFGHYFGQRFDYFHYLSRCV